MDQFIFNKRFKVVTVRTAVFLLSTNKGAEAESGLMLLFASFSIREAIGFRVRIMIDAHPDSLCLWLEDPRIFRRFQTKGFIQGKTVTRFQRDGCAFRAIGFIG